jgi:hypothetical protein
MIGSKENYVDSFFRDLTMCLLDTLEGKVNWTNRFSDGDVAVKVPFYYSMVGDERFLLDSFQDDIVSNNRFSELNTDIIPRGHITLKSWSIKSDQFRNPNIWLRNIKEDGKTIKTFLNKVRAIPIKANYEVKILLKTEIDIFKASESLMNLLWLYKFMYFEFKYLNIDAIMLMPDDSQITISREKSLSSDNGVEISLNIEVHTFYPSFIEEDNPPTPMRTKWYVNLINLYSKTIGKK